jgi:hypothetical protein
VTWLKIRNDTTAITAAISSATPANEAIILLVFFMENLPPLKAMPFDSQNFFGFVFPRHDSP